MKTCDPVAIARAAVAAHPSRPATSVVHDSADVRLVVFRIAAGQAVPVHMNPSTVVLHVLSGAGLVTGADGEQAVSAGAIITYAPGEPHGMRATTAELILLAVIAPRPASRTAS